MDGICSYRLRPERHISHAPGRCASRILGRAFWDTHAIVEHT